MVEEDGIIINVAEQQLLDNRIDILTVDDLRRKGTNWTKIAAYFHVGRRSLYRWRERNNHIDPLEPLTNEQLDGRIIKLQCVGLSKTFNNMLAHQLTTNSTVQKGIGGR